MLNRCQLVRSTCAWVAAHAESVAIHPQFMAALAQQFAFRPFRANPEKSEVEGERTLMQLFLLHSMNFCFWPVDNFEFEQLAHQIRLLIAEGVTLQTLSTFTQEDVAARLFQGKFSSLAEERAAIIRQVATAVLQLFGGSFTNLVASAHKSAVRLLNILCETFPSLQDHSIYRGHQVHFYKRAQLLISCIYQEFRGQAVG